MQVQKSPNDKMLCILAFFRYTIHVYTCSNIHLLKDAMEIKKKLRKLNKL